MPTCTSSKFQTTVSVNRATRTKKKKGGEVDAEIEDQSATFLQQDQRPLNGSQQEVEQFETGGYDNGRDLDGQSYGFSSMEDLGTAYDEYTALPESSQEALPDGEPAAITQEEYESMIDLPLVSLFWRSQ